MKQARNKNLRQAFEESVLSPFEQNSPGRIKIKDLPAATLRELPKLSEEAAQRKIPLEFFEICMLLGKLKANRVHTSGKKFETIQKEVALQVWKDLFNEDAPSSDHALLGLNWAFSVSLASLLPDTVRVYLKADRLNTLEGYDNMLENYPYNRKPHPPHLNKEQWTEYMQKLIEVFQLIVDYENMARSVERSLPFLPQALFAIGGHEYPLAPEQIKKLKDSITKKIHEPGTKMRMHNLLKKRR